MTNGEKLCIDFPNMRYGVSEHRVITTIGVAASFDLDWWNAEYQEPTTKNNLAVDAVSRAYLLDDSKYHTVFNDNTGNFEDVVYREDIEKAPPVTPQEPRKGHWIDDKCSVCGKGIEDLIDSQEWYRNEEPNFCPFCGAKMIEPQESEE